MRESLRKDRFSWITVGVPLGMMAGLALVLLYFSQSGVTQ